LSRIFRLCLYNPFWYKIANRIDKNYKTCAKEYVIRHIKIIRHIQYSNEYDYTINGDLKQIIKTYIIYLVNGSITTYQLSYLCYYISTYYEYNKDWIKDIINTNLNNCKYRKHKNILTYLNNKYLEPHTFS